MKRLHGSYTDDTGATHDLEGDSVRDVAQQLPADFAGKVVVRDRSGRVRGWACGPQNWRVAEVQLICTADALCDAHHMGDITTEEKCPDMCEAPGCREPIHGTAPLEEAAYCAGHAAMAAAGAEGDEMLLAARKADRYGVTLARLLREAVRTVPLDPEDRPTGSRAPRRRATPSGR